MNPSKQQKHQFISILPRMSHCGLVVQAKQNNMSSIQDKNYQSLLQPTWRARMKLKLKYKNKKEHTLLIYLFLF